MTKHRRNRKRLPYIHMNQIKVVNNNSINIREKVNFFASQKNKCHTEYNIYYWEQNEKYFEYKQVFDEKDAQVLDVKH